MAAETSWHRYARHYVTVILCIATDKRGQSVCLLIPCRPVSPRPLMLLTFILIIISIPSHPHFFIPGLKPSFSANPSHRSPSFSSSPGLISRIPRIVYRYVWASPFFTTKKWKQKKNYFCFPLFSCWFRAVDDYEADSCRLSSARQNNISYRISYDRVRHLRLALKRRDHYLKECICSYA